MRILTVSDKIEPALYDPFIRGRVGSIDLVLACGDLPEYYLEFIVGLLGAPLFYVNGNHDRPPSSLLIESDHIRQPDGPPLCWARNLHGQSAQHGGLLLAGLEGCRQYSPGKPYQYTEEEMRLQVARLVARLAINRLRYGRYLDVLITHAPPRGIHDAEDLPHRGFESYLSLLRRCRPALMIHGHTHLYDRNAVVESEFGSTRIINTYGYRVLEMAATESRSGWQLVSFSR